MSFHFRMIFFIYNPILSTISERNQLPEQEHKIWAVSCEDEEIAYPDFGAMAANPIVEAGKKEVDEGDFAKCLDRRHWAAKLPLIRTAHDPRIASLLR